MPSSHDIYICTRSIAILLAYASVLALFSLSFENAALLLSWDRGLCKPIFPATASPPVTPPLPVDTDPLKQYSLV